MKSLVGSPEDSSNCNTMAGTETVTVELPGEMSGAGTAEKRGLQKMLQQLRSGSGISLLMGALSSRKAWTQFAATDNFKVPTSLPRLTRRFYRNIEHFQANYLFVFLGLFAYCLITTPLLLIAMVASFFGFRKLTSGTNSWKVGGWELSKSQQYCAAGAASMMLCWLAGAGAVLFWVLGATVTVVALHAGLYDSEALAAETELFSAVEQV